MIPTLTIFLDKWSRAPAFSTRGLSIADIESLQRPDYRSRVCRHWLVDPPCGRRKHIVNVLQHVTRQDEHCRFIRSDKSGGHQFFEARKRGSRRRFTADTLLAQLGFR